jgi:hypothetical protein
MTETNVAVILAVSDYQRLTKLPACKNDGTLMRDILRQTGRFAPEHTFYADSNTDSGTIKTALPKFIGDLAQAETVVKEVFVYYSGHGMCDGSDFYYLLSDYDQNRLNQTTLSNAELDSMLRNLSPHLAVKVVDACHSGTHYVKSAEDIEKALRESSSGKFNNCYFMFSSEQHQSSWQDERLSYFTRAFARSLLEYKGRPVRYKDIISFISDQFLSNSRQKPIFVTQAGFTEVFADSVPSLTTLLESNQALLAGKETVGLSLSITSADPTTTTTTPPPKPVLAQLVKEKVVEESGRYCTEGEANAAYTDLRKLLEQASHPEMLSHFYTLTFTFLKDSYDVPAPLQIAKWLAENKNDYFVELRYERERYESDIFPTRLFGGGWHDVLKGFDSSVRKPPFRCVHAVATPKYLNLPQWICYVALVTSRVEMRAFYTFAKFVDNNWQERKLGGKVQWKTSA